MNNTIHFYYKNIITYDLLTKLTFTNLFEIPTIVKINLNMGLKNANGEKKKLINSMLIFKLITNQNSKFTISKKSNLSLNIKKGSITGCKLTLQKKSLFFFLEKLVLFILSQTKINNIILNQKSNNILNFKIKNILNFFELESEFLRFQKTIPIDVTIHSNVLHLKEFYLLLNAFLIFKTKKELQK